MKASKMKADVGKSAVKKGGAVNKGALKKNKATGKKK